VHTRRVRITTVAKKHAVEAVEVHALIMRGMYAKSAILIAVFFSEIRDSTAQHRVNC
jgi:hypothetical protein